MRTRYELVMAMVLQPTSQTDSEKRLSRSPLGLAFKVIVIIRKKPSSETLKVGLQETLESQYHFTEE